MVMEVLKQREEEKVGISEGSSSQTDILAWLLPHGFCDPGLHKGREGGGTERL